MGISATIAAVGAVSAGVQAHTAKSNAKKARDAQARQAALARKDARDAQKQARKAEVFSETEGKGQGTLGTIRSGISDNIDDTQDTQIRQGKSKPKSKPTLSI